MKSGSGVRNATVADLYAVDEKAELVNGNIIRMPPTGGRPGKASLLIAMSLHQHGITSGNGEAVPDNTGFLVDLPHRQSFSPDAAFWTGAAPTMKFYNGAPVFAVEVRSESDYGSLAEKAMRKKRRDYFAAGTLVVWDVDLLGTNIIKVYSATNPDLPRVFGRHEIADAEPAVPGWTFAVNQLMCDSHPGNSNSQ